MGKLTQRQFVNAIQRSDKFDAGEKLYLEYQYGNGSLGDFYKDLFSAIGRADSTNLVRLATGFPAEVKAYLRWTQGDLHDHAEAFFKEVESYV